MKFDTIELMKDDFRQYGAFRKAYRERKPIYEKAVKEAKKSIAEIKRRHQRKATLRIAYVDGRVKSDFSIIKKAIDRGIRVEDVFDKIDDIVGLRVVVNNLKDVDPFINELEAHPRFTMLERNEQPGEKPYKAVHLKVIFTFPYNDQEHSVVCEIQIRTLLQDAWAILTHRDVYKNQADLSSLAQVIADHLSGALDTLDHLADRFRDQIEQEVIPPNDLSDDAPLDKEGIAFLCYELFGEKPQEYEVEYLLKRAAEYGVGSIGDVRKGLDEKVVKRLVKIHDSRFPGIPLGSDLLEYGMLYAIKGPAAYRDYKAKIESEWEEIEAYGRDEALAGLPDTFDEFVEMLEEGNVPWEAIKELGGVEECARCSVDILAPDAAAEAILHHYGHPDTSVDLEALMFDIVNDYNCPFEPESVNTSGICPYCDYVMSKDD